MSSAPKAAAAVARGDFKLQEYAPPGMRMQAVYSDTVPPLDAPLHQVLAWNPPPLSKVPPAACRHILLSIRGACSLTASASSALLRWLLSLPQERSRSSSECTEALEAQIDAAKGGWYCNDIAGGYKQCTS